MAVTSRDLDPQADKGKSTTAAPPPRWATPELGLTLLAFGLVMWIVGARFTVDGVRIFLNLIFSWMNIPYVLPVPPWYSMLGLIGAIGWICSRVEVVNFPIRRVGGKLLFIGAAGLIGWGLTSAADLGTTVLGVLNPGPRPWPVVRWVATTPAATAVVSSVLTFLPEWLIVAGWWMLRGRHK